MLGVAVLVGVEVPVLAGGLVGVRVAGSEMGVLITGRKGVRVGLPVGISGVVEGMASGKLQPDSNKLVKNILTRNLLILIQHPNLQLHFPDGF